MLTPNVRTVAHAGPSAHAPLYAPLPTPSGMWHAEVRLVKPDRGTGRTVVRTLAGTLHVVPTDSLTER